MSDRDEFEPTTDEKRVSELIRSLPRAEADAGFRDRLRADFVAGRLEPTSGPIPPRPVSRRRWGWGLIPLAAVVLVAMVVVFNGGPALQLSDVNGDGTVTVDGRVFQAADRDGIAGALRPGASVELSEGVDIDVFYEGTAVFQLSSATATIPGAPGRWIQKSVDSFVQMGELRILTGPGFSGAKLSVRTPEGEIVITGSLVSVFRDGALTCVCVQKGSASVGIDAGDMENIPPGKRKVMYADGKPSIVTDIAPPHMDHLVEFEAKYSSRIRSAK